MRVSFLRIDGRVTGAPGWVALAGIFGALGCGSCSRTAPEQAEGGAPATALPPAVGVGLTEAPPDGEVGPIVRRALAQAASEKRALVVYVGAVWCEPCQRFHDAAVRGQLNGALPPTTLLDFDLDRDGERLAAAGYVSKYIPLFALARPDGTASGRQVEGGIKGEGAVDDILPRLQALLAR